MSDLVVIAFPTEAAAEEVAQKAARHAAGIPDRAGRCRYRGETAEWRGQAQPAVPSDGGRSRNGCILGHIDRHDLPDAAGRHCARRRWRGAGGALTDVGIDDNFMKEAAQTLQSGNAALFLLIRKMTTDKVLAALQGVGGTVMRTSFDHTKEEALRQALAAHVAATPAA